MEASSRSALDRWLLGICFSRTFAGLVMVNFAAALPVLQREWGLSAAAAGSISSGYHLGYAVSLVVFSSLADLLGPKRIYLISMTAGGVFSLAFAFWAEDFLSALILYSLVGVSLGGTYTTGLMLLSGQYPANRRGMAMGFFIASTSLGYALSLVLSGLTLPLGGYKLSFLVTGLGPAAGALLSFITLARTRVQVIPRPKQQRFMGEVLRHRPTMLLIGGYTFHNYELLGMWAWTPAFMTACLAHLGLGELSAVGLGSYLNASFHLTGLLASFSMGLMSDRLGRVRVMVFLAGLSSVCSLIFGWTLGWPFYLTVVLGLVYAFAGLGDSPVLSASLTEVVNPAFLGAAFGIRSLLGFGAGALSPLVFGAILDWTNPAKGAYQSWGFAFGSLGLSGLLATVSVYLFGRTRRRV